MDPRRLLPCDDAPVRPSGDYVLYWMISARRARSSHALDHALRHARALGKPLLVFEPLRFDYRWASVRHHAFVVDGMIDNAAAFAAAGVTYLPYVEPSPGAASGLLEVLAARACVVVTDVFPGFFLDRMVKAAAAKLPVRVEAIDGNGVLPIRAAEAPSVFAHAFRRHMQRTLPTLVDDAPEPDPLHDYDLGPATVPTLTRWAPTDLTALRSSGVALPGLDTTVRVTSTRGGAQAGAALLDQFLRVRLPRYADDRSDPAADVASGLSPYLHYGHVGAHEVVRAVLLRDGWTRARWAPKPNGRREGWWNASPEAESFLDELITWRERGYGFCWHRADDFDQYDGLPTWALASLEKHAGDKRPVLYDRAQLAAGHTHDPIWNAAQAQLLRDGVIQNYLRMLWGKKVLEWSASPREAFDTLIELNNRYALDGRDPNSYSGIAWTFGRFDRPWGPERPIFGTIRYMSSDATRKKLDLDAYLRKWGSQPSLIV